MGGSPVATANLLKSFGARRFVGSGAEGGDKIGNRVTDASAIPALVSVKVPLTPVISKAFEYFASVAVPKVITSDPLTPPPLKVMGIVAECAYPAKAIPASAAMAQCVFFIPNSPLWRR